MYTFVINIIIKIMESRATAYTSMWTNRIYKNQIITIMENCCKIIDDSLELIVSKVSSVWSAPPDLIRVTANTRPDIGIISNDHFAGVVYIDRLIDDHVKSRPINTSSRCNSLWFNERQRRAPTRTSDDFPAVLICHFRGAECKLCLSVCLRGISICAN